MTKPRFTPPTEFPAEYVYGDDNKAVILGRGPNERFPFIGYDSDGDAVAWTEQGWACGRMDGDLRDIPSASQQEKQNA